VTWRTVHKDQMSRSTTIVLILNVAEKTNSRPRKRRRSDAAADTIFGHMTMDNLAQPSHLFHVWTKRFSC